MVGAGYKQVNQTSACCLPLSGLVEKRRNGTSEFDFASRAAAPRQLTLSAIAGFHGSVETDDSEMCLQVEYLTWNSDGIRIDSVHVEAALVPDRRGLKSDSRPAGKWYL